MMVDTEVKRTLVYTNQEPSEEGLIGELTTLQKEESQQGKEAGGAWSDEPTLVKSL
jgi:hypothetical protein